MIELGKVQKLLVVRKTKIGVYLNSISDKAPSDILLPIKQVPAGTEIGGEIEVFVYKDSEDRLIATVKRPIITLGEVALLRVAENTEIGAFLDWGLEKDLLLPFKEQVGKVSENSKYLVGLYLDSSNRLCATMRIYEMLSTEAPYKPKDRVHGTVYNINKDFGAFVAVENKYHGLIPNKELYRNIKEGDNLNVRVVRVRQDGKLELSLRQEAFNEIESDAGKIMEKLRQYGGKLPMKDSSSPELIKSELNMSKAAFKRAVGRLLKEGALKITEEGIEVMW